MIDQLSGRFLITDPLVALQEDTDGEAMMEIDPDPAWLAADVAFDADPVEGEQGDELARALLAAAPFHRAAELDERIAELRARFRRANPLQRSGLEMAIAELVKRRSQLPT